MLRSIRWTLQIWHAAILLLVLLGFGFASYYEVSRTRYMEVDAELSGAVHIVAAYLAPPPRRPGPPPRREDEDRGPPGSTGPVGALGQIGAPGGPAGRPGPGNPPRPFDQLPPDQLPPDQRQRPPEREPPPRRQGDQPRGLEQPPAHATPLLDLPAGFLDRYSDSNPDRPFFVVRRSDGGIIKAAGEFPDRPDLTGNTPADGVVRFRRWADVREAVLTTPLGTQIIAGRSVRREQDQLGQLVLLLAGTGAAVLALGLAGGWFLSRRVVRPIGVMSATAEALSATHLSGRIQVDRVPSELGLLAQVLNAAFARLESAFLQQARFTADASHELRTPLSVIYSHAELALSRERSNEEYRQTLATCLKASGRMRSLVESLLFLARADAGGLELAPRAFDLRDVARDCVGLLTPLAQHGGIDLQAALGPVEVTGDPSRIGQVVTNLITNAIRYNHSGGMVRVSTEWVRSTSSGQAGGVAVLTVADTGMGIDPEDQPRVFERFFRADKARSRKAGGSGLGLAICKSIVDAHGGSIAFSSVLGQGTTFVVRLPAMAPAPGSV
jgi:two-component system OmpR family sensor kinase